MQGKPLERGRGFLLRSCRVRMCGGRAIRQCCVGPTFTSDALSARLHDGFTWVLKSTSAVCRSHERGGCRVPVQGDLAAHRAACAVVPAGAAPVPKAARSQAAHA